jgi:hypothetical protein
MACSAITAGARVANTAVVWHSRPGRVAPGVCGTVCVALCGASSECGSQSGHVGIFHRSR